MILPDYKRPFDPNDFRGYFKWTISLSKKIRNKYLYHACHEEELKKIIGSSELDLRSQWSINLPEHGTCKVPGIWTGLNSFVNGNYYGPFIIKFPLSILDGKQFMAFRRGGQGDRKRYFFVQYDAMIPIYSVNGDIWRKVNPGRYFTICNDDTFQLKDGAIYDIVLTTPISLSYAISIYCVKHDKCISHECNGLSLGKSRRIIRQISKEIFINDIISTGIIKDIIKKYPDIEGEIIEIVLE